MRLGCALVGSYFLAENMGVLPFGVPAELLWPGILILLGLWLLAKAIHKPQRPKVSINGTHPQQKEQLSTDDSSFEFNASFGESTQYVELACLSSANVSTSFGEYTIDLSGIEAVEEGCQIELNSAFGELTLLVPQRFAVKPNSSTFLAQIDIKRASANFYY